MEKDKIFPIKSNFPYQLSDLSVVIPQASQYVRRLKWFIPQYINATSSEVVKNTVVVYDIGDIETEKLLNQYSITGLAIDRPQSTYKQQRGFEFVQTRLCVRMHNDAFIVRSDWAEKLIEAFNKTPNTSQIIGAFNISGGISKEILDKMIIKYPFFQKIYDNLDFSKADAPTVGAPYLSAFFMAGQTYILRTLYSLVININDGKMDKEDVILTLLASLFNVNITSWNNMYSFVKTAGARSGDFDEGFSPIGEQFLITEENKINFPKAEFRRVNYE